MLLTNPLNETSTPADVPNGKPPEKQVAAGRDGNGRFAKGNLGGPGNPFARQIAGFRKALCAAVTEQDVTELAGILLAKAKAGDLPAMKLLFQYTLGKPAEATDPDSLDAQEMRLFQQSDVKSDTMTELAYGTPAELAVRVLRVLLPERAKKIADAMAQMFRGLPGPSAAVPPPSPEAAHDTEARSGATRAYSKILLKRGAKKFRGRKRRAEGRSATDRFTPVTNGSTKRAAAAPMENGANGTGASMATAETMSVHR